VSNITFLIGNGFDLNLGLKTKYSDVTKKYIEKFKKTTDINIQEFINVLQNDYETWANFEVAMGKHTKDFNKSNINNFIHRVETYIDVLKEEFEYEESRIDDKKHKEDIVEMFRVSLIEFHNCLFPVDRDMISNIVSPSGNKKVFQYNFITFNYTNVLEKCTKIINSEKNDFFNKTHSNRLGHIVHIHGTLLEDLILGVDNTNQIANKRLINNEKLQWMIKPNQNKSLGRTSTDQARKLIDTSLLICVFGMSLGVTDKTWWEYIFNWLKSNKSKHLIIFKYNEIDKSATRKRMEEITKVKNTFFSVLDSVQDQEWKEVEDRIHISLNNENMFNVKLTNDMDQINKYAINV